MTWMNAMDLYTLQAGVYVVYRPKLVGPGLHYGLMLPDFSIIDLNADSVVRQRDAFGFAQGKQVMVARRVPESKHFNVQHRLEQARFIPTKYDLMHWNCEQFATWLAGEEPHSGQVGIAVVGTLALFALVAARASA